MIWNKDSAKSIIKGNKGNILYCFRNMEKYFKNIINFNKKLVNLIDKDVHYKNNFKIYLEKLDSKLHLNFLKSLQIVDWFSKLCVWFRNFITNCTKLFIIILLQGQSIFQSLSLSRLLFQLDQLPWSQCFCFQIRQHPKELLQPI